ncbi:WD40 repeat [Dillenia turbinata]|uniref:WD40 repeat n=1 Tax=Dillenia turbinata TaxID=194707 RepID=A0AAN8ZQK4_9MAGN
MKRKAKTNLDKAVVEVWQREVGQLSSRNFAHRLAASEDLVLRLRLHRKLERHKGCVNTVSFNADGETLVTGSDDRRVILWDWETGNVKLSFHSGHNNNVFQAKIMPYTDDRTIVTCAADGQVRHAQILDCGKVETALLARHQGRAHKLAIEPGSPHTFYTCGEDGVVQHVSFLAPGSVTAVVGCYWYVKGCYGILKNLKILITNSASHPMAYTITSATEDMFDLRTGVATKLLSCLPMHDTHYLQVIHLNAIAIDPRNPNLFAVAGSDAFTRLYDIRKYRWDGSSDCGQPADYFCPEHLIAYADVGITGLAFSDHSELLVSYNDESIYLFTRDMGLGPDPVLEPPASMGSDADDKVSDHPAVASQSAMDAIESAGPQVYKGHRNCETVKGVSFYGPGCEYVVSGSDCGRIFIWRKKDGQLIRVMEADKHIVNCIESHPHTAVLASSGIEKDIKIWTPTASERATLPANIEQLLTRFPGFNEYKTRSLCQIFMPVQGILMEKKVLIPVTSLEKVKVGHRRFRFYNLYDEDDTEDEDDDDYYYSDGVVFDDNGDGNDIEDLLYQLFSLRRERQSPEHNEENSSSTEARELLQFILTYNANSDGPSDDEGNASGSEDPFS